MAEIQADCTPFLHREPVLLVGLAPSEEDAARRSIEDTPYFHVVGAYRTYQEALELMKSVCIPFVIFSTNLSDMTLTAFLEQANDQFHVYAAAVVPEGACEDSVCTLAIEAFQTRKVVNFMRAPITCEQITQISHDLAVYQS